MRDLPSLPLQSMCCADQAIAADVLPAQRYCQFFMHFELADSISRKSVYHAQDTMTLGWTIARASSQTASIDL